MTDYNAILDSELQPDAPITSNLGFRWRDNPIALGEGSASAPRVASIALGGVYVGNIDLLSTTAVGFTGLERQGLIFIVGVMDKVNVAAVLQARYTDDNGVSWGAWQAVGNSTTHAIDPMTLLLNLETGVFSYLYHNTQFSGTNTVPANCNGFQVRFSSTSGSPDLWAECFSLGGLEL